MNNHADASPMPKRGSATLGWIAVIVSSLIACFWALWGSIENFHEGWYYRSTLMNLGLMLIQYLSPMLAFVVITVVAIVAPRLGSILYVSIGVLATWFFRGSSWTVVYLSIVTPLMLLAVLFWFGRPHPRRRALWLALGLPGLTLLIAGIGPAIHVFRRVDDGDRGARLVTGNQVALVWAPAGPGWPNRGVSWDEAYRRSRYLKADGLTLADSPQDIWRLPTVEEAVRSQALHGRNCGGSWNTTESKALYLLCTPDKETPLWDPYSRVIYWWTATEAPNGKVYRISYNGQVWTAPKTASWGYLGFRAVKQAP
ncbi:MAG: DUF7670 domain-containing protein [Pyrinomonadaceae bacterium]